uniref:Immunoglobulin superfamily member 10 n=1 Tax=Callorhinchus milii TaxID=7868 RepID=A0A4W3IAM7_CALMI
PTPPSLACLGVSLCVCSVTACPKPCACYVPTEVHCTFRSLNAIPANIGSQVERINFGYNNLVKLTRDDFTGLKSLELLMLHSNGIQEIPGQAFRDLQSLQVLKMSYNKVKALNRDTFLGLYKMVRLHMDHNRIEFINPEAFYGLTALRLLQLEGNLLQQLHPDTFVTFRHSQIFKMSWIKHIYLADNALTSIPSELLSYIPELESIYLHGNKWQCDCELRWLAELNQRRPGECIIKCKRDRSSPDSQMCPVCVALETSGEKDLFDVSPAVFSCNPPRIVSPLLLSNSSLLGEGNQPAIDAKDFVAPLGQMSLNMSDQSGNGAEMVCNVQKPKRTPGVALDHREGFVLLNTSLSIFLVCNVNYEQIQRLWGILAMYSDSPLRLERDDLLTTTPYMSYRYRQTRDADVYMFTGIEVQITADPAWLLQGEVTLQLDRTQTTLNILHIRYLTHVQLALKDLEAKPRKNNWVMIKRGSHARRQRFVMVGAMVELECEAFGDPKPTTEWIFPEGSKVRAPYNSEDGRITINSAGKFTLRVADRYDTGMYHCLATNFQDSQVLSFRVTVLDPAVEESDVNGPTIFKSPGESLHLPCQAIGIPKVAISWILPDHRILDHAVANKQVDPNGTLEIRRLRARDSGFYRCLAANPYGLDLLALQVTVTGVDISSQKESEENNDAAEESRGSGESEPYPGEPEDVMKIEEGNRLSSEDIFSSKSPTLDYDLHQTTVQSEDEDLRSPARRGGNGAWNNRWWAKRRRLKHQRRKLDPQQWAEYLEKIRNKSLAKTQTTEIPAKPQTIGSSTELSVDEDGGSGKGLMLPEEQLIAITTKPKSILPTPLMSVTQQSTTTFPSPRTELTPVVSPSIVVTVTEQVTKDALASMSPKAIDPTFEGELEEHMPESAITTPFKRKSAEANPEIQVTVSGDTKGLFITPTANGLNAQSSEERISSLEPRTEASGLAPISFETTQKITSPGSSSVSTTLTQQVHITRDATTKTPLIIRSPFGRRRKLPPRFRYRRPGLRKHRYKIVRPGMRRKIPLQEETTTAAMVHSESSTTHHVSPITETSSRSPAPLPGPGEGEPDTHTTETYHKELVEGSVHQTAIRYLAQARTSPKTDLVKANIPEVTQVDSQAVAHLARSATTTLTATSTVTTAISTTTTIHTPAEGHSQASATTALLSTLATPTIKSSKIIRGKIPWNRLFGLNGQKELLRRLRKPDRGTIVPFRSLGRHVPRPTDHSRKTSAFAELMETSGSGMRVASESILHTPQVKRILKPFIVTRGSLQPTTRRPFAAVIPVNTGVSARPLPSTPRTIPRVSPRTRRPKFRRRRPVKTTTIESPTTTTSTTATPVVLAVTASGRGGGRLTRVRVTAFPSITVGSQVVARSVTVRDRSTTLAHGNNAQSYEHQLISAMVSAHPFTINTHHNVTVLPTSGLTLKPHTDLIIRVKAPVAKDVAKFPTTTMAPAYKTSTQQSISPTSVPPVTKALPPAPRSATARAVTTTTQLVPLSTSLSTYIRLPNTRKAPKHVSIKAKAPATKDIAKFPTSTMAPAYTASTQPFTSSTTIPAQSLTDIKTRVYVYRIVPNPAVTLQKPIAAPTIGYPASSLTPSNTDKKFWLLPSTKAIKWDDTLQTKTVTQWPSSTQEPSKVTSLDPLLDSDLDNAIGIGEGKVTVSSELAVSSSNTIDGDLLAGSQSSRPQLVGGNAASFTVLADSDAFLPCEATGNPTPIMSWTKISTGRCVKRGNKFEVFPNGTLSIQRISVQDRGQYLCIAENEHGSARLLLTLSVVAYAPKITEPRLKDITVHAGYPVEMRCRSEGRPSPSISWLLSNRTLVRSRSPFNGRVLVQADGTLRIKAVTVYDRGNYKCVASNPAGMDTVIVRMRVVASPPVIVEEKHETIRGKVRQNLQLPCTAVGTPQPTVTWVLFDGTEISPLQFLNTKLFVFTNGTIYVKSLALADSGNYECIATSSTGTERRVVSLVVEQTETVPKIVASSPRKSQVKYGTQLQLDCSATGDPKPRIIWRLPSKLIVDQWQPAGKRIHVLANGTLVNEAVTERDGGDYLCVARNELGDDLVLMKVAVRMKAAQIERKQSIHKQVSYGQDLRVDCKASGSPEPQISWALPDGTMVNSVLQADDRGGRRRRYIVFDNGTLYYNKVGMAEEGDYTCYAQNTLGKDEMKVRVTVVTEAPHIKKQQQTFFKVPSGESVTFDCPAVGEPKPRILWMLPSNEFIAFSSLRFQMHSNGSLSIKQVRLADSGEFTCIARNPAGDDTITYQLVVVSGPPLINGLYSNKTTIRESAVKHTRKLIDCATEGLPKPHIMWIMPDNIFLNAPYYGSRIIVHRNGTLEIRHVRASDQANFICVARNDAGETILVVNLEVTEMLKRPVFKNPFNEKIIVKSGSTVILNCSASGNPPPQTIWVLPNGSRFTNRQKVARYQVGADGTFIIHNPTIVDAGKYHCAAKNKVGYIEKLIILQVGQKPFILTRPLRLTRSISGESLFLHCSANGIPKVSITWTAPNGYVLNRPQINGKYTLYENGTLVVRDTNVQDRGNYVCKAHNTAGLASITIPVIIIAYPPRITNGPPTSVRAKAGSAVQLNCMAIGIPKPEIVWELPNHSVLSTYSKGSPTGSELLHPQGTLVIQKPSSRDSGTYKCTAKNRLGSDSRVSHIQVI